MSSPYIVKSFSEARQANSEAIAHVVSSLMNTLGQVDEEFTRWDDLQTGKSIHVGDIAQMSKIVERARHRRDIGKAIIEELGFHPTFVTLGRGDNMVSLSVVCGSHSGMSRLENSCELKFDANSVVGSRLIENEKLREIFALIIDLFEAQVGIVRPEAASSLGVQTGWLTYVRAEPGAVPVLPSPVYKEPFAGGTLIALFDERFEQSNPAHIQIGQHVKSILVGAGLV